MKPRLALIEDKGLDAVVTDITQRSLSAGFRERYPGTTEQIFTMVKGTSPAGYLAGGYALLEMDLRASLVNVDLPVLVIAGTQDTAIPPEMGVAVADGIAGARLAMLDTAHLSNIEQADKFNQLISDFLVSHR